MICDDRWCAGYEQHEYDPDRCPLCRWPETDKTSPQTAHATQGDAAGFQQRGHETKRSGREPMKCSLVTDPLSRCIADLVRQHGADAVWEAVDDAEARDPERGKAIRACLEAVWIPEGGCKEPATAGAELRHPADDSATIYVNAQGMPIQDTVAEVVAHAGGSEPVWINPLEMRVLMDEHDVHPLSNTRGHEHFASGNVRVYASINVPRHVALCYGPNGLVHAINVGK